MRGAILNGERVGSGIIFSATSSLFFSPSLPNHFGNACELPPDCDLLSASALSLFFAPQVQATVVGLLAAVAAVLLGSVSKGNIELSQAAVLCASSVTTAFIAALSLGECHKLPSFLRLLPYLCHSLAAVCSACRMALLLPPPLSRKN